MPNIHFYSVASQALKKVAGMANDRSEARTQVPRECGMQAGQHRRYKGAELEDATH